MRTVIPYGRHSINQADIDAVVEVLRSEFLTQGPAVPAFEKAIADYCGAKHAVAVNSATSALHIACLVLGVSKGDVVWTTPITFVASANCALYCGATVDFVDIDPRTYNMSIECLAEKLAHAESVGNLPKVVIPVHLCGQACDMASIFALSKQYGFNIIEDASHAIGGKYCGESIGSCHYSDITVFSFHPVKIITTGEGGGATTNNTQLAKRMQLLRSHGITRDESEMTHELDGAWYYQQIDLGYNYRMTDLQAALGLSQIQRLDEYIKQRHIIAKRYDQLLAPLPVNTPWQRIDSYSSFHLYVIRLRLEDIKKTHRQVFEELRVAGVGVSLHYIPVYTHPYYQKIGFKVSDFPMANNYYAEAISLPIFASLAEDQQNMIIDALERVLK